MASLNQIFLGILILHIYAQAAPSDVSKLEDIAKVDKANDTANLAPKEFEENADSTEAPRQKRQFYNPYGYGFPPISKLIYPSNLNNRDNFDNIGTFGIEDPLAQIHRRVQEIANIVRQPPAPPIPHVPIFYPVLIVPQFDCACNPADLTPSEPTTTDIPTPNVTTRFPEMEDERQNWGIVTDDNGEGVDTVQDGKDFARPISFDPIMLNRPNARPPPPVEHGTVQSESGNSPNPESSENSSNAPPSPPPPPSRPAPPPPPSPPSTQNPFFNVPQRPPPRRPPPVPFSPAGPPTLCDGAILTCCHQPRIAYDCFAIQGCSSFTPYGNPCDTNTILRVIEKFQSFYDNRNG